MITITESTSVVVKFRIEDYSDALHFADQAERDQYSAEQIEAMCLARYNNWLAILAAPPREPSAEEKAAQLQALLDQQQALAAQIAALSPVVEG
jgi:hypothetical protein